MGGVRRSLWFGASLVLVVLLGAAVALHSTAAGAGVRNVAVGTWPLAVAVDPQTGYAFVVDHSGRTPGMYGGAGSLSVVDTANGTVLRSVAVGPDPRSVAVDEGHGRVFVANDDDASVTVLDTRTGTPLGSIGVGARPHGVVVDAQTGRAFVVNTADATVSVVDTRRGTVLSSVPISGSFALENTVVDARRARAFVATTGGIAVLDGRSGAVRRILAADQGAAGMAVDTRSGHLFVTGDAGLSEIDPQTGRILRTIVVGTNPGPVAVDARRGRVFVVSAGNTDGMGNPQQVGSVSVVDARSGRVLRTVPVGYTPMAIAVDERSGRAVVVNAGGAANSPDSWSWVPDWLRQRLPFLPGPAGDTRAEPGSVSIIDAG